MLLTGSSPTCAVGTDVSRRRPHEVGYRPTAARRIRRREGELALNQGLVLTPDAFVRGSEPVRVTGAEAVRSSIGLDAG